MDDNILRRALSKLRYQLHKLTNQYPQSLCTAKKMLGEINYTIAVELKLNDNRSFIKMHKSVYLLKLSHILAFPCNFCRLLNGTNNSFSIQIMQYHCYSHYGGFIIMLYTYNDHS